MNYENFNDTELALLEAAGLFVKGTMADINDSVRLKAPGRPRLGRGAIVWKLSDTHYVTDIMQNDMGIHRSKELHFDSIEKAIDEVVTFVGGLRKMDLAKNQTRF